MEFIVKPCSALTDLGYTTLRADSLKHANTLPNLQLIEGAINQEKLTMMPSEWLRLREP
jgi:hypothetical protein